jgi:hypothetical protein
MLGRADTKTPWIYTQLSIRLKPIHTPHTRAVSPGEGVGNGNTRSQDAAHLLAALDAEAEDGE